MMRSLISNTILMLFLTACSVSAQDKNSSEQGIETDKRFLLTYPNLENSDGDVVLENEHVVLQRLVVGPGEWEGIHSHPGNQLSVHIKSGDLIYVTLKGDAPIAPDVEHVPLSYPNIPMELLLENNRMIVQRVQIEPGQWEGIHGHRGNQIFIHIKGGVWAGRMGGKITRPRIVREDGVVGWMDAIDLSEEHDSGNVGDTTIDLIWITLK